MGSSETTVQYSTVKILQDGNPVPWVPEVFLACGGNFRCWPKADTSSAVPKPETALEKSLAPRVVNLLPWS